MTLPYLAIGGPNDTTAPLLVTQQRLLRMQGPRQLIALVGAEHGFDAPSATDLMMWSVTFLFAKVRGILTARAVVDDDQRGRLR